MFTVNRNPSAADLKKFGIAMLIGFGAIGTLVYVLPWFKVWDAQVLQWVGSARQYVAIGCPMLGFLLWLISVVSLAVTKPIYITWMSVAVPIGIVMSTFMLTVLFVVLLPVFSLIIRFGDPLGKKIDARESYWEDYKPHAPTIERMQRPF